MPQRQLTLYPELAAYLAEVEAELEAIPPPRRAELEQLARFIRDRVGAGRIARLVFICTHNSRRSQLAQVWAATAAQLSGVAGVETYSGGTEATAFNARAVAALERAGFRVATAAGADNPVVAVRSAAQLEPLRCFSKVYDQPPNPTQDFCAIMTCSTADQGCPLVLGASQRIAIRYDDPKDCDDTDRETGEYDARCRQIAREMLAAFARVRAGS